MEYLGLIEDTIYPLTKIERKRKTVRVILVNDKKEIALIHIKGIDKFGNRDHYETLGGGVELNEELLETLNREVKYISYNSMDVEKGTLFVCKGVHFKAEYLQSAFDKGAFCYIGEKVIDDSKPYIVVNNMRVVLSEVGKLFYDEIWNKNINFVGFRAADCRSFAQRLGAHSSRC